MTTTNLLKVWDYYYDSPTTTNLLQIWEYHYASDFASGVRLLVEHDGGKYLTKQAFQRLQMLAVSGGPVDGYNLGKLMGALAKVTMHEVVNLVQNPSAPSIEDALTMYSEKDNEEAPDAAKKLTSPRAIALHKEQSHHHALMVAADTDKERGEHATEILRISGELDDEYDRLRGDTPRDMPPPRKAAKATEGLRRLQSLRTRIARLSNQLIPAASGERKADLEKELELKQAEAQRLVNELA